MPAREEWDRWLEENPPTEAASAAIRRIRKLEALGARVHPVAADIAVAEQVEEAIASANAAFGPVNGVFHAAGVLNDDLIALKSEREIEEVFSPKLYGTLVLDRSRQVGESEQLQLKRLLSADLILSLAPEWPQQQRVQTGINTQE